MKRPVELLGVVPVLVAMAAVGAILLVAGCGSGGGSSSTGVASSSTPAASTPAGPRKGSCGSSTPSASSESASTAAGDIPDSQQFIAYRNGPARYSISFPEGWARTGHGSDVTFQDKSNTIVIRVAPGARPTPATVRAELEQEAASDPCLQVGTPQATTAGPNRVVKVTYTTEGQKSPVTGRRPKITVDRYVYFERGKVATVDLGTPVGVDNVDAYRMISESFRWG
jgi:hypothetical protein